MTAIEPIHLINPDFEYLLAELAAALQLTPSHHSKATGHYSAVTDWLAAPASALAHLNPRIYPQGSMALGTTVKPWRDVEYDLDFVCEVLPCALSANELYAAVYNRLYDSLVYRPMLSFKKRCVSLAYSGDFHMDIIPAMTELSRPPTGIIIPDRQISDWSPSNPKGFIAWFKKRCEVLILKARHQLDASVEPLPGLKSVENKAPLAIAVQLIKRARDVLFKGDDDAPRSILLTTFAGHFYTGHPSVAGAVLEVARGIRSMIQSGHVEVANPVDPTERFCDALTPARITKLEQLASHLELAMITLNRTQGLEEIQRELAKMFGEGPTGVALARFGELQRERRDAGRLTFASQGLGVVAPVSSRRVPSNNYYGD